MVQQQFIQFTQFIDLLNCAYDAALCKHYTYAGIVLRKDNCRIVVHHNEGLRSLYVELDYLGYEKITTQVLHINPEQSRADVVCAFCDMTLREILCELRLKVETEFVRVTLERQDLRCIGKKTSVKSEVGSWDDVLYSGSFLVDCPKAWGGRGYSMLNYRVYSCGKTDVLKYGIYGELIDCLSDGTYGLPVQLPFIEATPSQLADFADTTREWAALIEGAA